MNNNVIIDPITLAFPDGINIPVDFEDYLEKIQDYQLNLHSENVTFYISSQTSELLFKEFNYPDYSVINESLKKYGLEGIYQPRDIVATINQILLSPFLEDAFGINDVLFETQNLIPEDTISYRLESYKEEFEKLIFLVIFFDKVYDFKSYLISINLNEDINMTAKLIDIEYQDSETTLPQSVYSGTVKTISEVNELYKVLDPIYLWKNSTEVSEYEYSFSVYIQQNCTSHTDLRKWKFGKSFFDNIKRYGFGHLDSKINSLFRSLLETISNSQNRDTHWLRTRTSGDAPQLTRGADRAWRRDIDREFHLHYWEVEDSSYEFSNVVTHDDMTIYM